MIKEGRSKAGSPALEPPSQEIIENKRSERVWPQSCKKQPTLEILPGSRPDKQQSKKLKQKAAV